MDEVYGEIYRICRHGIVYHPSRPGPDHHVVTTSVDGSRVAMHPVHEFDRAVRLAIGIANLKHVAVNVRCWHVRDLCWSLGIDPKSLNITKEEVIGTLKNVLRTSQDAYARREAYDELVKMGVIR